MAGLIVCLCWSAAVGDLAVAQDDSPAAGPPLSLSARLRAQGHPVTPAEASYLDADEQVAEQYVRLLVVVQELAAMPPTAQGWRSAIEGYLRALADLDPAQAPVPPPEALRAVHAQAVAYRTQLGTAARQWLEGVRDGDPAWLVRGNEAYGAAERARFAWHQALLEHYTGEPVAFPDRAAQGQDAPVPEPAPAPRPGGGQDLPDGPLPPVF